MNKITLEFNYERGARALLSAIIYQSIADYNKALKLIEKPNLNEDKRKKIEEQIKENESFLKSERAIYLLELVGIYHNPEKLIKKLKEKKYDMSFVKNWRV